MKGFRGMLVLVMIIALPMTATAVQFDKKATTIDELAKMYDSTQCKSCHPDIYAQWEKSHHARPLMGIAGGLMMTPVVKSSAFAVKDPKQATLKTFPCFKCHLPQAFANADDSVAVELTEALFAASAETATDKEKADARAKVAKLQITCLVCHNEKAITHKLVLGKPENGVLYGNKEVASHPDATYKTVKKSVITRT